MELITREYCEGLTTEEKTLLKQKLLERGLDLVFVEYVVYGKDYKDVIEDASNPTSNADS